MELKGAKAVVVGMAKSGLASVELLVKHGAVVSATDLKASAEVTQKLEALHAPFAPQSVPRAW